MPTNHFIFILITFRLKFTDLLFISIQAEYVSLYPAKASGCQSQTVFSSASTGHQTMGFQPLTVQPAVLEAWVEGIKKDMLLRQELMFQMLRSEMLQARPPMGMGRAPHGLYPSY